MKTISKKTLLASILVLTLLLILSGVWYVRANDDRSHAAQRDANRVQESKHELHTLSRQDILKRSVDVTGTLEPQRSVVLAAEQSGHVRYATADVGDRVYKDSVIVELDADSARATLNRARALESTRRAQLESDEIQLRNARSALTDAIDASQSTLENARSNAVEPLFDNSAELSEFGVDMQSGNTTFHIDVQRYDQRKRIIEAVRQYQRRYEYFLNSTHGTTTNVLNSSQAVEEVLVAMRLLLDAMAEPISNYTPDDTTAQNVYGTYLTAINAARAQVTERLTALRTARYGYKNARVTDTSERVAEADAAVREARVRVNDAVTRAPFTGVIAEKHAEVGQSVQPGTPLYKIVDTSAWTLDITLADTYNQSLRTGTDVTVHVDGLSGTHTGTVTAIAPVVNELSRKVTAEVTLKDMPENARAGLFARATLSLALPDAQYRVPSEYVGHGFDGPYVTTHNGTQLPITIQYETQEGVYLAGDELKGGIKLRRP